MENLTIKTRTAKGKLIFAIVIMLLFQLNVLAAPADPLPTDFGGGDNPVDAPVTPIDDYVWVLMAIGIDFTFYKYKDKGSMQKAEGRRQ